MECESTPLNMQMTVILAESIKELQLLLNKISEVGWV